MPTSFSRFAFCISTIALLVAPAQAQEDQPLGSPTASPGRVDFAHRAANFSGAGAECRNSHHGPVQLNDVLFKNLKVRWIGPALMGGRISDIAIDPRNPAVFYVGHAHGGVFKTGDNGVTFDPIFDEERSLSIGAIAVAPSDSDVVWVGSGEPNDRNSSGWGDGVYRTTDGGEHWTNVGLKESRAIARIVVHPSKPEVAYVAAVGNLWKDGGERGLYKTTDGGKSWKLVLKAEPPNDSKTGCGDVVFDPSNPETVYAVLYARQRTPWTFIYGAGLHRWQ